MSQFKHEHTLMNLHPVMRNHKGMYKLTVSLETSPRAKRLPASAGVSAQEDQKPSEHVVQ